MIKLRLRSFAISATRLMAGCILLMPGAAQAQCSLVYSGLEAPIGIVQSETGNLLVSESGSRVPNTGRISIVNPGGSSRILLSGLPSGINDVGGVTGPAGLFLRGRTLYVAIGVGDVSLPGPIPGSDLPNPAPSSPLFSSVLAMHFSSDVENTTGRASLINRRRTDTHSLQPLDLRFRAQSDIRARSRRKSERDHWT
jgi:hypothetical protein